MGHYFSFFRASLRLWRRHFIGVFIALAGLAVAFAVATIALFYSYDTMRSDSWMPNVERLYRLNEQMYINGQPSMFGRWARVHGELAPRIQPNFSEVEETLRLKDMTATAMVDGNSFSLEVQFTDPSFAELAPHPLLAGNVAAALRDPRSIVLTRRQAERLFAGDALRRTLDLAFGDKTYSYRVGAVIENTPLNSQLEIDALVPWDEGIMAATDDGNAFGSVFIFVRLAPGAYSDSFAERFNKVMTASLPPGFMTGSSFDIGIEPVLGARFFSKSANAQRPKADGTLLLSLLILAGVLLLAACMNSISLFTALNLLRLREVAVRRILGAGRLHLAGAFLFESIMLVALAYGLGILLASDLQSVASDLGGVPIPVLVPERLPLLLWGLLVAACIGLLGAFFLAARAARLKPQDLLHGTQNSIVSSRNLFRQVLVAMQAMAVVGTIIGAAQILYQVHDYVTRDRGFRMDGVLMVTAPARERLALFQGSFLEQVKAIPGVARASASGHSPFPNGVWMSSLRTTDMPLTQPVWMRPVGPDYIDALDIKVVARLDDSDWHERTAIVALPRSSLKAFGFASPEAALGQLLFADNRPEDGKEVEGDTPGFSYRIVAVTENVTDTSYSVDEPMVYYLASFDNQAVQDMLIIVDGDQQPVTDAISAAWHASFPDDELTLEWLRERVAGTQKNNVNMAKAIGFVSACCAVLCLAGLYGMASHWATTRRRELALRRVLGAGGRDIARLFLVKMLLPVLAGGLVSLVPVWLLMQEWLTRMREQAPLPLALYGLAVVLVVLIAAGLLVGHIRRILRLRPASVLYHE
ncbi:MAG: ABC transporter permease [Alphaproteobacteria bacterium]|nr:MAG: ABC transporter permease [Alphaproteobacteria bacterium]